MCFSAPASFTASALLAIMSGVLIFRVRQNPRLLPLALVPLFFALQQFSEGLQWISGVESSYATQFFLFFAFVFWPIWIPFACWFAENIPWRKQVIALFLGMGIVIALFLAWIIPHSTATLYKNSIHYAKGLKLDTFKVFNALGILFYGISILGSIFLSSIKKMWILGLLVAISGIVILWMDRFLFISLWCFIAALLSLLLCFITAP